MNTSSKADVVADVIMNSDDDLLKRMAQVLIDLDEPGIGRYVHQSYLEETCRCRMCVNNRRKQVLEEYNREKGKQT